MSKKEKERWDLDRFLGLLTSFRHGEVIASEGPDFLVDSERGSVGIELTELHRSVPDGVTPGQAQEAMRERVVGRAKELFVAASAEPLYVSCFSTNQLPSAGAMSSRLRRRLPIFSCRTAPLWVRNSRRDTIG
jgi:hypothetical protein